jgi:hypothetical protein
VNFDCLIFTPSDRLLNSYTVSTELEERRRATPARVVADLPSAVMGFRKEK